MNPPTIKELIQCATREASMRRRVYPTSNLRPEVKERELRAMDAIVSLLGALKENKAALALLATAGFRFTEEPDLFA